MERIVAPALIYPYPGFQGRPGHPMAALSLEEAGDMGYSQAPGNPRRGRFVAGLGLDPGRLMGLRLIHSKRIFFAQDQAQIGSRPGDGIICRGPGPIASVTVADCMPIWLYHPDSGYHGVLHSGWAGTGILAEAVEALGRLGAKPGDLSVILGPSIRACCYGVSPERALQFMQEFGYQAAQSRDDRWYLDLVAANLEIAGGLGIGRLAVVGACTACGGGFGSCRRQGPGFTKMLALSSHGLEGLGRQDPWDPIAAAAEKTPGGD